MTTQKTTQKIELLLGAAKASMMMHEVTGQAWYKQDAQDAFKRAQELYREDQEDSTGLIDMSQHLKKVA